MGRRSGPLSPTKRWLLASPRRPRYSNGIWGEVEDSAGLLMSSVSPPYLQIQTPTKHTHVHVPSTHTENLKMPRVINKECPVSHTTFKGWLWFIIIISALFGSGKMVISPEKRSDTGRNMRSYLQQKANSKNITQHYCLFIHHTLHIDFLVKLWPVYYHIVRTVFQFS